MASLSLRNITKIYPFNGDDAKKAKKKKKGDVSQGQTCHNFLTLNTPKFRVYSRAVQSGTAQALRQVSTLSHRESNGISSLFLAGPAYVVE